MMNCARSARESFSVPLWLSYAWITFSGIEHDAARVLDALLDADQE